MADRWRRLIHRRVPVALQVATTDCGPAALAMVLRHFGDRTPAARIREVLDAGRDGVTALDLRDAARSFGLTCRAFDLPALRHDPHRLRKLPLPLIAHREDDHFVVIDSIRRTTIGVVDPAVGRLRIPYRDASAFTGIVLLCAPGPHRPPTRRTPHPARALLLPIMSRHRALLALVALASILLVLAGLVVPLATARIVNTVTGPERPGSRWLVEVAGLALAGVVFNLSRALAVVGLQRRLGRDVTGDTVARLFRVSFRYFERRDAGDLVARVHSASSVSQILTSALIGTVLDAVLAIGYLVVVAVLAPGLAVWTAALIAVQLLLTVALTGRSRRAQREELLAGSQQTSLLVEAISGAASIRASGVDEVVVRRWSASYERELAASFRGARLAAIGQSLLSAVALAAPLLLLVAAARGSAGTPGAAVGLAALANAAVAPTGGLALGAFTLAQLAPLLDRLDDIASAEVEQPVPGLAAPRLRGRVEFIDVGFRYDRRSPFVLRGLTATAEPGMKVGIVGASGSGKSTLGKLVTGLHRPTEGDIRFDGRSLHGYDLASVRRQLGVVMQEPFVTAGTIREALMLGHPDATDRSIERVARLAEIHDDIMAMPMGYQTRLGDGGRGLSGGQRQRLALARALLGDPAVLVLDEATSALDPETEARVEANLRRLPMTRIVIAHRISTVSDADLVIVLDTGRVVRQGGPEVLVAA